MQLPTLLQAYGENLAQGDYEHDIQTLINRMTLDEKIGQMRQISGPYDWADDFIAPDIAEQIRRGSVGSILNHVNAHHMTELQRIARHESRLGIPLLMGRDVIHGFHTIFPLPLGQAASWSPELVEQAAQISAHQASMAGINWTFSPMIDIARDPRWGRVAESLGEDPILASLLGQAMVRGYQGEDLSEPGRIAACAKHFVGYGASESGKDYNTCLVPENELRNVYMRPFYASAKAGVASFMTAFCDLNGMPATGHYWLNKTVLRDEWHYDGVLLSDWESVKQLIDHGVAETDADAAQLAHQATVDMEMVSDSFAQLPLLLERGVINMETIDAAVARILRVKYALGLFNEHGEKPKPHAIPLVHAHQAATDLAAASCVLLKNHNQVLPLAPDTVKKLAVVGPLADDEYEQLGTWIFDADLSQSVTLLDALKRTYANADIEFAKGLDTTRSKDWRHFAQAMDAAKGADAVVLCLGEEAILSGEAHCRTSLDLPGAQAQLIDAMSTLDVPIILVIMAGRPITLNQQLDKVDAVLFAWHPGSLGGPAIAELIAGQRAPTGRLPISFPRTVGQVPIYYNDKPGGKPVSNDNYVYMDDFPLRAPQTSLGMACSHMDTHFTPQFPFGFGLTYTQFAYANLVLSQPVMVNDECLQIRVDVTNTGAQDGEEVVQLYVRDKVATVTRPVRELKQFKRIQLAIGETQCVEFELHRADLMFFDINQDYVLEPGSFQIWVGGDATAQLTEEFVYQHAH